MGIGNPRKVGDERVIDAGSLPLMGIGNLGRDVCRVNLPLLITPHGDRKPGDTVLLGPFDAPSLPLMGIGNRLPRRALITPHGDRKPATTATSPPSTESTHYPSWGSETFRTRPPLPARDRPHYPSWGSETLSQRGNDVYNVVLITPHGDRKPPPLCLYHLPDAELITPHGDRKRATRRSCAREPSCSSLPLMGIGNSGYHLAGGSWL